MLMRHDAATAIMVARQVDDHAIDDAQELARSPRARHAYAGARIASLFMADLGVTAETRTRYPWRRRRSSYPASDGQSRGQLHDPTATTVADCRPYAAVGIRLQASREVDPI